MQPTVHIPGGNQAVINGTEYEQWVLSGVVP